MADECTFSRYAGDSSEVTVADGTAIVKGTLMEFSASPNTAVASTTANAKFAGVAVNDKTADDGRTKMAVKIGGEIEVKFLSGVAFGDAVALSATENQLQALGGDDSALELSRVVGYALDTVAAGAWGTVRLKGF